mmetsp:Transcript_44164/g.134469  ORF Transcript_44164/g.134469 Transcript_44164/m.134469 type:complete len:262 (-) Transcript_44164:884-1669(-)
MHRSFLLENTSGQRLQGGEVLLGLLRVGLDQTELQHGPSEAAIDRLGTSAVQEPQQHDQLGLIVERARRQQRPREVLLDEQHGGQHDPKRQPLLIVIATGRLDGHDAPVSSVQQRQYVPRRLGDHSPSGRTSDAIRPGVLLPAILLIHQPLRDGHGQFRRAPLESDPSSNARPQFARKFKAESSPSPPPAVSFRFARKESSHLARFRIDLVDVPRIVVGRVAVTRGDARKFGRRRGRFLHRFAHLDARGQFEARPRARHRR